MKAVFSVTVAGQDITSTLDPILISLQVSAKSGQTSDTASLEVDDTDGRVVMPGPRDRIIVALGWEDEGLGIIFDGIVDEISAKGDRGGRTLTIGAKGMDTRGRAKQGQRRHFDDTTIGDAFAQAGKFAGLTAKVDPALASIVRPYLALDDESFIAFGQRLARELGGTFKIMGNTAVLAQRNAGVSPSGAALSSVTAKWGDNLISYAIKPILGRPVEKQTLSRWYDRDAAGWKSVVADTETGFDETTKPARFSASDEPGAGEYAGAHAKESDRKSGTGSVSIQGNINAQPEGECIVVGARPGVDGTYRIEGVQHSYSRSGFITDLTLGQPKGGAGHDSRGGEWHSVVEDRYPAET